MVPRGISIACFLLSFYFMGYQYSRVVSRHNIFNSRFALLVGAIVLAALTIFWNGWHPLLSVAFFVLGLWWVYASYRLWRLMPPSSQRY